MAQTQQFPSWAVPPGVFYTDFNPYSSQILRQEVQRQMEDSRAHAAWERYTDAKRWFELMESYEAYFKKFGDRDPWRTADIDSRLCRFITHELQVHPNRHASRKGMRKLEKDVLDAAFFNVEKSRRDAEAVLDDNLRAIIQQHVDSIIDTIEQCSGAEGWSEFMETDDNL